MEHFVLNTKFTEKYNAAAPVAFYDEINRFWQAFANKANRDSYLSVVRTELKPKYRKLFEYYDSGNARLFFVTNHRRNERQFEAVKANGVLIFHLDELLQFTLDYLEDAMPRAPSMILTGVNTVLSADKRDTEVPTSIVFAKLIDFVKYISPETYACPSATLLLTKKFARHSRIRPPNLFSATTESPCFASSTHTILESKRSKSRPSL